MAVPLINHAIQLNVGGLLLNCPAHSFIYAVVSHRAKKNALEQLKPLLMRNVRKIPTDGLKGIRNRCSSGRLKTFINCNCGPEEHGLEHIICDENYCFLNS